MCICPASSARFSTSERAAHRPRATTTRRRRLAAAAGTRQTADCSTAPLPCPAAPQPVRHILGGADDLPARAPLARRRSSGRADSAAAELQRNPLMCHETPPDGQPTPATYRAVPLDDLGVQEALRGASQLVREALVRPGLVPAAPATDSKSASSGMPPETARTRAALTSCHTVERTHPFARNGGTAASQHLAGS
jgi:hypothetical protein